MRSETRAYAKINLWLDITGRRADGYHLLWTVMRRIDLYDDITIQTNESGAVTVECDAPGIPSDERNIAYRACVLFRRLLGQDFGAHITIKKRIGELPELIVHIIATCRTSLNLTSLILGSVSLAVLLISKRLVPKLPMSVIVMAAGAALGADIPFCIVGGTAVCKGIGEIITPVSCADMYAVVIKPEFSCSTALAYKSYDERPLRENSGFDGFVRSLDGDISGIAAGLYNVFDVLYADERIEKIKRELITHRSGGLSQWQRQRGIRSF